MIIVGLTGGIGSGKTTVARLFTDLGIPVYIADVEAKRLMNTSKVIKRQLKSLFGEDAYIGNHLNRPFIASQIYNDTVLLEKMNAVVHPKVGKDFKRWVAKQISVYVIKEAAIIFEQQKQSEYDLIILVTAPLNVRMLRLLKRDDTTEKKITDIMKNQMSDEEKIPNSDFVIVNDILEETKKQVIEIHQSILQKEGIY